MTDTNLTDEWNPLGAIVILVTSEHEDGSEYRGHMPLHIEAKAEARRVVMNVDADKAPVVIARWRDGIAESVNVFGGEYLPGKLCEAIREQLVGFVANGNEFDVKAATVTVHDGCKCHTREGRLDVLRTLRRLYYATELAQRGGAAELGSLASDIANEASDLYDTITHELFDIGEGAKDAVAALPRLRRGAIARARLDMALNALAAVPNDPDLTPAILERRHELMRDLAEAEAEEHDAMSVIAAALTDAREGTDHARNQP